MPFCIDFNTESSHSNRTRSCPAQPGTCPPDHRGHVSNVAPLDFSSSDSKEDRQVAVDEPVSTLRGWRQGFSRERIRCRERGDLGSLNASVIASLIRA